MTASKAKTDLKEQQRRTVIGLQQVLRDISEARAQREALIRSDARSDQGSGDRPAADGVAGRRGRCSRSAAICSRSRRPRKAWPRPRRPAPRRSTVRSCRRSMSSSTWSSGSSVSSRCRLLPFCVSRTCSQHTTANGRGVSCRSRPKYFRFTLGGPTSRLKVALESCARGGDFENIEARLTMFGTQEKPSVVMRKQLASFVDELRQMPLPQQKNAEGVA
jgi:hypothetical protein